MPATRGRIAPLLRHYEPDLALCVGFPWKIPPDALAAPAARHRQRAPVAAPALSRPEPGLVGDPQRRERDRLHVPLHGRRARHGEHPRPGADPARGRALVGGARAEARRRWSARLLPGVLERVGARRPRRSAGRERGELLRALRARVRVDRLVAAGVPRSTVRFARGASTPATAGDRGALAELDGETRARAPRRAASPAEGAAMAVRRRHTLDRGDGGGMRPVIGITSYAQDARWGVWHLPAALVPLAYVDAIERAGGRAVVIPPSRGRTSRRRSTRSTGSSSRAARTSIRRATAPRRIRRRTRRRHAATPASWRCCRRRSSATCPTLAICRGFQLLNVARGGDLVQHLPEAVGNDDAQAGSRRVRRASGRGEGGLAARARSSVRGSDVTSHHHQALGRVGDGPRRDGVGRGRHARGGRGSVAAASPSASSGTRRPGEDAALFEALVEQAREYRASRGQ